MNCPNCNTPLTEKDESCPKCNTPVRDFSLVRVLQISNRTQRNLKIAAWMTTALALSIAVAYAWYAGAYDPSPEAGEFEVVVPKDSLKNLGFTIEEQNSTIDELNGMVDALKAQIETLGSDSTEEN